MVLTDDFIKTGRSHPGRKRCSLTDSLRTRFLKKIHSLTISCLVMVFLLRRQLAGLHSTDRAAPGCWLVANTFPLTPTRFQDSKFIKFRHIC